MSQVKPLRFYNFFNHTRCAFSPQEKIEIFFVTKPCGRLGRHKNQMNTIITNSEVSFILQPFAEPLHLSSGIDQEAYAALSYLEQPTSRNILDHPFLLVSALPTLNGVEINSPQFTPNTNKIGFLTSQHSSIQKMASIACRQNDLRAGLFTQVELILKLHES